MVERRTVVVTRIESERRRFNIGEADAAGVEITEIARRGTVIRPRQVFTRHRRRAFDITDQRGIGLHLA